MRVNPSAYRVVLTRNEAKKHVIFEDQVDDPDAGPFVVEVRSDGVDMWHAERGHDILDCAGWQGKTGYYNDDMPFRPFNSAEEVIKALKVQQRWNADPYRPYHPMEALD